MSKKTTQENYRVVIEPRRLGDFGLASVSDSMVTSGEADRQRQYKEQCEEIAAEVKRHVDNVGWVGVVSDEVAVCEHCGWQWTEDSADYNGGCCEKDQAAEDLRTASVASDLLDSMGFPSIRKEGGAA